jgi:hypothetical protein
LLELRITRFIDHLGQRLHDLFFGVVDVAQRVHEQIVHRLDVFREEAHGGSSFLYLGAKGAISFVQTALSIGNVRRGEGFPATLK